MKFSNFDFEMQQNRFIVCTAHCIQVTEKTLQYFIAIGPFVPVYRWCRKRKNVAASIKVSERRSQSCFFPVKLKTDWKTCTLLITYCFSNKHKKTLKQKLFCFIFSVLTSPCRRFFCQLLLALFIQCVHCVLYTHLLCATLHGASQKNCRCCVRRTHFNLWLQKSNRTKHSHTPKSKTRNQTVFECSFEVRTNTIKFI